MALIRDVCRSWPLVLDPVDETSTRLLTRSRGVIIDRLALGLVLIAFWHLLDLGMQRQHLLNLRRLVKATT